MDKLKRKELILKKTNELKENIVISRFKHLRFCSIVDEETINKINLVLCDINSYDAEPENIIIKENEHKKNINNLKNVIEKIQNSGKWLIPSLVNEKWYEIEADNINFGIEELFEIYGEDFFTIVSKEKNYLIDVFWDEEYKGMYSPLGIYCIFIKPLT